MELVALRGMLDRCVFVMPPQAEFLGEVTGIAWRDVWTKVREQASGLGLELPRYHSEGALIAFGPSPGTMAMVLGVDSSSPSLVAAQLARVRARREDLRHLHAGAEARADIRAHRKARARLRPAVLSMVVKYVVFYGALVAATLMMIFGLAPPLAALLIPLLWGSLWLVNRSHDRADRRRLVGRVGEEATERALRGEVWAGQCPEELKASRGLPDFSDLSPGPEGMKEVWHYGMRADGTAATRIVLVDGRVRSRTDPSSSIRAPGETSSH